MFIFYNNNKNKRHTDTGGEWVLRKPRPLRK